MIRYDSKNENLVNAMINLGLKISNSGFQYILDAIDIIKEYKDEIPKQMYIYDKVAEINNVTATRVERCMRHEIKLYYDTFANIPKELTPNIFSYTGRLTCKEFITKLAYMFKRDGIL